MKRWTVTAVNIGPFSSQPFPKHVLTVDAETREAAKEAARNRLIAAAPELLAATRILLHAIEHVWKHHLTPKCVTDEILNVLTNYSLNQARAAISKAEGTDTAR